MLDLIHSAAFKEFGHALTLFAVIFHGSASLYIKHPENVLADNGKQRHPFSNGQVHPLEVQFYFCLGIFISCSCAAVAFDGVAISMYGLISGFLAVAYHTFSFSAANLIGFPVAAAAVSSVAILASFSFGYVLLDNAVWSSSMCSVALSMMVLGVVGVCWCAEITTYLRFAEERSPILQPFLLESSWRQASPASKATGLLLSVIGGLCGATILVPWHLFDSGIHSAPITRFIESFGLGAMATGGLLFAFHLAISAGRPSPPSRYTVCSVLSGIIWNVSNVFSMFAIRHLGYSAAYPSFHCQMAVVVFWNIYLCKEGTHCANIFLLSAFITFAGAFLLSMIAHV